MCNMTYVSVNIDTQGNGRLEGASWDPYDILLDFCYFCWVEKMCHISIKHVMYQDLIYCLALLNLFV